MQDLRDRVEPVDEDRRRSRRLERASRHQRLERPPVGGRVDDRREARDHSGLAGGWYAGLAVGAGIAVIDAAYAAAGAAGAAVILWLGARTLKSARRPREIEDARAAATPRRAFLTSLAGTAANPATIVSWAAVFAAAGAAGAADSAHGAALLVAGVGLGSLAWVSLLATGTAGAGRALGPRVIRIADAVAGAGLLAFGALLALHALT